MGFRVPKPSRSRRVRLPASRRTRLALAAGAVLVLGALTGFRQLVPDREFGVLHFPGGARVRIDSAWALAPPGLVRLSRYPRGVVELELPEDDAARAPGADGSRYRLRGRVAAEITDWRAADEAARGGGLEGVLARALTRVQVPRLPGGLARLQVSASVRRDLLDQLGTALASMGVGLRRGEIRRAEPWFADGDEPPPPAPVKVFLLGLDGADWQILDPLMDAGRMPHLKALCERGVRGDLLTIRPTLSPVVWTTVATGVPPTRHGVLDFLVPDPAGGPPQPVTARERRAASIWQILSRAGVDVGVTAWWATWPAEPVRGFLVSDRLAYQLFGIRPELDRSDGKVWPPELYAEVRRQVQAPESVSWEQLLPFLEGPRRSPGDFDVTDQERLDGLRTLLASTRTYLGAADTLRRRLPPSFEALYLEGTDTVAHLFMEYRPPKLPWVDPEDFLSFHEVVNRYYERVDAALGDLLERLGPEWNVIVVSDHGFLSGENRPRGQDSRIGHGAAASWHRRFGVALLAGPQVRSGGGLDRATVYDVAPTILALLGQPVPVSWPGRVWAEALAPAFLDRFPVRYARRDPPRDLVADAAVEDPQAEAVRRKLESLGYVDATPPAGDAPEPSGSPDAPVSVTASNNRGVALLAEGRVMEAEKAFRSGLARSPGHPTLLVNLGIALKLQGRLDEARRVFEEALRLPLGRRAAGHHLAGLYMRAGEWRRAEALVRELLEEEPAAAELHNVLGEILEARGDAAGAEAAYRRAARLDPSAAAPRNHLGSMARARGNLEEAARWFRAALEADPFFMGAYNNLALVYQDLGRWDDALELYRQALERAPDNAVVLNNLASLHYARGEMDQARALWLQAIEVAPRYASPYNNLAGLEIAAGRLDEAEELLRKALELDPDYGDAYLNLALVHEARGETAQARRALERAAQDPRARGAAILQRAEFELRAGRPEDAIRWAERVEATGDTRVLNLLGQAYYRLGRPDEAAAMWRRSLARRPDQAAVRAALEQLELDRAGSGAHLEQ